MTLREVFERVADMAENYLTPEESAKLAGLIMEEFGQTDDVAAGAFITGLGIEQACELTRSLMKRLDIKAAAKAK